MGTTPTIPKENGDRIMIYCCADIHGSLDIKKIELWEEEVCPSRNDYLIILGDWGAIWYGNWWDEPMIAYWDEKPYRVLFIDGNHENHKALDTYPIVHWNGGRAHLIGSNILHLMRGEIFTIDNKTFFCMGGGRSMDAPLRTEGKSWWPEEMPSKQDYDNGLDNLEKYRFKVDYILTHTTDTFTLKLINSYYEQDELSQYLNILKSKHNLQYKHHYFGHYHIDAKLTPKETCLYDKIIKIQEADNG